MSQKNYFKERITLLILLFAFMTPLGVLAQNIQLTGLVTDAANEAIIGASVVEKGTTNGVITDFDGNFTLSVSPKATIIISYVGYATQEIPVNGKTNIKVTLKEDTEMLDEVVVVGYGTMKKSDMTGAISSVDVDQLASRATTNPAEALQGKVAGVNIQKAGGNAGAGVQVKIRGVKTFGSNEPYYVIDGFPGSIENVNPSDIESMEILKDGAAAAIYGSRAANGVVLVTTKNGKKGDVKVDVNAYLSSTHIAKKLEMLDAKGYVQVHKQMYENYNNQWVGYEEDIPAYINNPGNVNTDWQKAMTRSGLSQNYMISVRGGSDAAKYSISYNRSDEKGIFLGNDFKQDNARAKLSISKYIFDIDANVALRVTSNHQPSYSLKEMYMISPLVPIFDPEQEYGYGLTNNNDLPNNRNVMADYINEKSTDKTYDMTANVSLGINIAKGLTFKTSYSYRGAHERQTYHTPTYIADEKAPNDFPYYSEDTSYWEEQVFDNVLNFNKEFNKHSINVMVGSSINSTKSTWNSIGVEGKTTVYKVEDGKLVTNVIPGGFLDESFGTIDAGNGGTFSGSGSKYTYNRASFFGRLNYSYAGRYLVQATVRRDGSSKFGKNSRWGTFPSVAVGWRISEESFFPKDLGISNLKIRASWGRLGNEVALGYYDFLSLIQTYNTMFQGAVQGTGNNPWPGSIATGISNQDLKWETTDTKNIGIDYGFFNNKLSGTINYYQNRTEDMLITKKLAPSAGMVDPTLNVGEISNKGIEFEINWADRKGDLDYSVGMNLATTKNKVESLADAGQMIPGEGLKYGTEHFPTQTIVGRPIGGFYLYRTDGIFQSMDEVNAHVDKDGNLMQPDAFPGDIRFKDLNHDGVIDDNDKEYCGSGIPKLEVNLNLSAAYKGFDFSMLIGSAWGYKLYNGNKYFYEGMSSGSNFLASTLNAWTPENRNTDVPRAVYADYNGNTKESDRFLENGDFVRLRQVQIGYTIPAFITKKAYIEKLRFYVSGENLFTITGYDGIDPEFSRVSVLNTGIDKLIYPFTRSFIFGLQLSF